MSAVSVVFHCFDSIKQAILVQPEQRSAKMKHAYKKHKISFKTTNINLLAQQHQTPFTPFWLIF